MKSKMIDIGRWILSALLVYGVFTETGIWTAIAIGLIVIAIERIWSEIVRLFKITNFNFNMIYNTKPEE
jgi:hypothetical protein